MRRLDPFVFEELLLLCFSFQGYRAVRNRRYTGDGGIDGMVVDGAARLFLLQAKRYSGTVKAEHIDEFGHIVESTHDAWGGFFIHCGRTGRAARAALRRWPQVTLISGQALVDLVLGTDSCFDYARSPVRRAV